MIASVAALVVVGLLSACMPQQAQWRGTATMKRNTVEFIRLTHDVTFKDGAAALGDDQAKSVDAFFARIDARYGDEISVDAGDGPEAAARRAAIIARATALGLKVTRETPVYGPALSTDGARIIVGRYVVTPPACPDWRKPAGADWENTPSSNFGCASQTNLGLMVAQPRDLLYGRDYGGPDTEMMAKAVKDYRDGKAKKLKKEKTQKKSGGSK